MQATSLGMAYWIIEYIKVFVAYYILMYVWPLVVFRKYLNGKSKSFKFAFCNVTSVMVVTSIYTGLGLIHILNSFTVKLFYVGVLLFSVFKDVRIDEKQRKKFKYLVTGTYGIKTFRSNVFRTVKKYVLLCIEAVKDFFKGHKLEYLGLIIVLLFGNMYFNYGLFQKHSYGTSDLMVHHSWVYGAINGQIFSGGVYPAGMHFFVAALRMLFNVKTYNIMLYLGGIHITVFLLSMYIFFKEIFNWKYSGLMAMALFLTLDASNMDYPSILSRLQLTLPMEFGAFTMFLAPIFLIRYLKSTDRIIWENTWPLRLKNGIKEFLKARRYKKKGITKEALKRRKQVEIFDLDADENAIENSEEAKYSKGYWDGNLLLFCLLVATSIVVHFYITIMMVFVCLPFVFIHIFRTLNIKRLIPLAAASFIALFISVAPMVLAFMSGIQLQYSLRWALSIMGINQNKNTENNTSKETEDKDEKSEEDKHADAGKNAHSDDLVETVELNAASANIHMSEGKDSDIKSITVEFYQSSDGEGVEEEEVPFAVVLRNKFDEWGIDSNNPGIGNLVYRVINRANTEYSVSYKLLYSDRALPFLLFSLLGALVCLIYKILFTFISIFNKRVPRGAFDYHICLVAVSLIFAIMYNPTPLHLPRLVDGNRVMYMENVFVMGALIVPIDIVLTVLLTFMPRIILELAGLASIAAVYALTQITGTFHGGMYYIIMRYDESVEATESIIRNFPYQKYTIVSPTDELYQVAETGWHEELITFMNESAEEEYFIPSKYVFLFLEKKPLYYAQHHFFSSPRWLAIEDKYKEKYEQYAASYVGEEYWQAELEDSDVVPRRTIFTSSIGSYQDIRVRKMLEATAFNWCEKFNEVYPYELHTYMETDNYVVYYFVQNTERLYQLGIR